MDGFEGQIYFSHWKTNWCGVAIGHGTDKNDSL